MSFPLINEPRETVLPPFLLQLLCEKHVLLEDGEDVEKVEEEEEQLSLFATSFHAICREARQVTMYFERPGITVLC